MSRSTVTAGVSVEESTSPSSLWLGHEKLATVQIYLHADMALKERAIARVTPPGPQPRRYRPADPLLAFLEQL